MGAAADQELLAGSYSSAPARMPPLAPPRDEDLAVAQQRRRVEPPRGAHGGGGRPGVAPRVVQLRARQHGAAGAPRDEDLVARQQRRRVIVPHAAHEPGAGPGIARRVVHLRGGAVVPPRGGRPNAPGRSAAAREVDTGRNCSDDERRFSRAGTGFGPSGGRRTGTRVQRGHRPGCHSAGKRHPPGFSHRSDVLLGGRRRWLLRPRRPDGGRHPRQGSASRRPGQGGKP
jgi:hypothetical protein